MRFLAAIASSVPLLYLSWNFLGAWRLPLELSNRPFIDGAFLLLLMETFAIFSTLFTYSLVTVENKNKRALFVGGVCAPFIVGLYFLGIGFGRNDIAASYALVVACRGVNVVTAASAQAGKFAVRWFLVTFTLILLMAIVSSSLPRLGITTEVAQSLGAPPWVHQIVGVFAIYYLLMAIWELLFALWDLKSRVRTAT